MPDFVLEIGTEEVPAAAVVPALEQLRVLTEELFQRERIRCEAVRTLGTPRRLVVYASGVANRQEDALVEHRGPARKAAFDPEGRPSRAAEGFARRHGLSSTDLEVRSTPTGDYVFAVLKVEGKPARDVLAASVPELLPRLAFPKFMRWGEGRYRFSRPIRWFLALLGDQVVPFEVEGVPSGRITWGHRFLPVQGTEAGGDPHRLSVESAGEYFSAMEQARVVVDPAERRRRIEETGNALAAGEGIRVVWDPELLQEVVYVVEHPTPFLGRFDADYLELPRPVLVSAMRKHQRYFYLENPDGSLAPWFLAVRNGGDHGLDIVREGNERVLAFRFNDARHHFTEDRKFTLAQRREDLRRIVFLEKLGTVYDRSLRLERVVGGLCEALGREEIRDAGRQAAALCKADLATQMVAELPELQGVIGCEYGLLEKLSEEVALAIGEQYHPRGAGDPIPDTLLGRLLALSDRLDLLVAAFSLGHIPTGSSDPFGLRRASAGVVALLAQLPTDLALSDLVDRALEAFAGEPYYRNAGPRPAAEVQRDLIGFFRPRLTAVLEEDEIRHDLIEAVLAAGYDSVPGTLGRARFLQERLADSNWKQVVEVGTRVRNILKPVDGQVIETDLDRLEHPTEQRLRQEVAVREPRVAAAAAAGDWNAAWRDWVALAPVVEQFFIDVLVNVEDPALRAARQSLLRRVDVTFTPLADFSRIADL
jgi:glycyl-tRNA synthetase beta chain